MAPSECVHWQPRQRLEGNGGDGNSVGWLIWVMPPARFTVSKTPDTGCGPRRNLSAPSPWRSYRGPVR